MNPIVLANFGGPRTLQEIPSFLTALLTDQEVVRTNLPPWLHRAIFTRVARKRALKIAPDYAGIGGKSPIFADTEHVAKCLEEKLGRRVIPFHRYLTATHASFVEELSSFPCEEIQVLPMFPQFSYATSGSIALWFGENLPESVLRKLFWIKSYAAFPSFVRLFVAKIRETLQERGWREEEATLLFSAHGVPQKFVCFGDLYERECRASFQAIATHFPKAEALLSYQSKFGRGEWLRPATEDVCKEACTREKVLVIPLSFTSDHIETLYEIEELYLPLLRERGKEAERLSAFNRDPRWIAALGEIVEESSDLLPNQMLIRYPQMDKWRVPCEREVCLCAKK